jgi:hypothetical protein
MHLFNIVQPDAAGNFDRAILEAIWDVPQNHRRPNPLNNLSWEHNTTDWHLAVSCLETLREDSLNIVVPSFKMQFAANFGEQDFIFTQGRPVPVIIHEDIMARRGLELGNPAFITNNPEIGSLRDFYQEAVIIGTYSGETLAGSGHLREHPYVIMPLEALEHIMGQRVSYITARVTLCQTANHRISEFREQVQVPLAQNFFNVGAFGLFIPLEIIVFDEEFRMVVMPLEQNLNLLSILFPVAIIVLIVIGTGLSLLFVLQNAKSAAIMRVLGNTKFKTRVVLSFVQIAINGFGVLLGLALSALLGMTFAAAIFTLALGYFLGSAAGSIIGAIIISRRPPLELLQVKE